MAGVDVVIPCYNYGRYLRSCVESVLAQRDVAVRVLIIDDSSSDDSEAVGTALAAADDRVEFRRHAVNRGHTATYNEGLIGWAQAPYSLLLSADDALEPSALGRSTTLMDAHPEVVMTYGLAEVVSDTSETRRQAASAAEHHILGGNEFIQHCCEYSNPVPAPCAVVRTGVQHQLGGYRADLPHTCDMEMWMRFALQGDVGVINAVQGYYRRHDSNMSQHYYASLLSDQRERLKACVELLAQQNGRLPQAAGWLQSARRRVAREAFWLAHRAFDAGNVKECDAALAFAEEAWPEFAQEREWKRFEFKRRLGPQLWGRLYPVLDLLGGRRSPRGRSTPFQPGELTGWWPGGLR